MSIEDRVAYITGLTFIMDFHEKLGTTKSPLIIREFQRETEQLVKDLETKEKELETRSSERQRDDGSEERTNRARSLSGGSIPDRTSHGPDPFSGTSLRR